MTESKWMGKVLIPLSACLILFSGGCEEGSGSSGMAGVSEVSRATVESADLEGRIVFHSYVDEELQVYCMNADGSGLQRLTDSAGSAWNPGWSPSGTRIVYQASQFEIRAPDIWTADVAGSSPLQLTNNRLLPAEFPSTLRSYGNELPAWSPNGDLIAYTTYLYGAGDIYTIRSDGSSGFIPTRLTTDPELDFGPVWSLPNGERIAFSSYRDGNSEIYVMSADGSNPTNLTNDPEEDAAADWSPNGEKIVFVSNRDGNNEIYVMDTQGGNLKNLSRNAAYDGAPAWSPDGQHIAFISNRDGDWAFYAMDADGNNTSKIPNSVASDSRPAWASGDGTSCSVE